MIRVFLLIIFLLPACAIPKPMALVDPVAVYKEGLAEGKREIVEQVERELSRKGAYGRVEPYHPVRLPADIRRVWIVDHPNEAGDLVSGHWAFIVVRPERWAAPTLPLIHRSGSEDGERIPLNIPVIEETGLPAPSLGAPK